MLDVAGFLAAHPPFDALERSELEQLADAAAEESRGAGEEILHEGTAPVEHVWVVREGTVEIVHNGRVLDLLGEGELFGHGPMLSGLPTGFAAVAAEPARLLRLPAGVAAPLLGRPAGLRYVTRSLLEFAEGAASGDTTLLPVGDLVRAAPVMCRPGTTIGYAARRMTEAGATSLVVDCGDGDLGIVTDRDLRTRVLAAGRDGSTPVGEVMSAPAFTVTADRLGGDVLLDMLDRGIRHCPVLSASGTVLGVVEDADLVALAARGSFQLRAAVARALTREELVAAAGRLWPTVVALHEAGLPAASVAGIQAVVMDGLTRRAIELAIAEGGRPPAEVAWVALGSVARREAVPSSDVDSALMWHGDAPREEMVAFAGRVVALLSACGFPADEHGANASRSMFARSDAEWRAAARSWLENPHQENAGILVSIVVDGRLVWGTRSGPPIPHAFRDARRHAALLTVLARMALSHRPPTGFLRGLVVEHSGEHRGRLDIKRGGLLPITDLARWAGLKAGVTSASTAARLRAAREAGTLRPADARTLEEAFELVSGLRLAHQAEQLAAGERPDDFLDPAALGPLTRGALKDAFRGIAAVQSHVRTELQFG